MQRVYLFLKGMAMGAADVVPGVSGGTIAFITGIYEELINSIEGVTKALPVLFKEGLPSAWKTANANFLLVLLSGVAVSVLSLAKGISHLLETQPVLVWSFFFGLIVASAIIVGKSVEKWNALALGVMAAGIGLAYYITIASPAQTTEASWFIFLSGSLAICAMILPGISGSFILLLLGKYKFIISALSDFDIKTILIFMAGCVVGLLSFARLLSWMFKNYKNTTIALLTGFMIGSLNKVWPWKVTTATTLDRHGETIPLTQESVLPHNFNGDPRLVWAIVAAIVGFLVIWVLENRTRPPKTEAS
jgi:putative membrane protein